MRKEEFGVDSFVHVYNRGNRKQPIVLDESDSWHFLEALYYFNNATSLPNTFREIREAAKVHRGGPFFWLPQWAPRNPIVKILAFILMPNHFHLLLKEIKEGGIALFMSKFGTGITNRFNTKYQETGSLFQGSYKAKVVDKEMYLNHLSVYIHVKNALELYPGGVKKSLRDFNKAIKFAAEYPYSSLADYLKNRNYPIIDKDILGEMFPTPRSYDKFIRHDMIGADLSGLLGDLRLEEEL